MQQPGINIIPIEPGPDDPNHVPPGERHVRRKPKTPKTIALPMRTAQVYGSFGLLDETDVEYVNRAQFNRVLSALKASTMSLDDLANTLRIAFGEVHGMTNMNKYIADIEATVNANQKVIRKAEKIKLPTP